MTTEEELLATMGQDADFTMLMLAPPIAFQRVFVDLTGSVTAALLLSACIDHHLHGSASEDGWYPASYETWAQSTGMSRKEQSTARKTLRDKGLLEERKDNYPAELQIRLNYDEIQRRLLLLGKTHKHPPAPETH